MVSDFYEKFVIVNDFHGGNGRGDDKECHGLQLEVKRHWTKCCVVIADQQLATYTSSYTYDDSNARENTDDFPCHDDYVL